MESNQAGKQNRYRTFYAISLAWQLGFLIVFPIGGFLFLGYLLDNFLLTLPFFLIIGLVAGIAITVYEVYHTLAPLISNNHQDD